jgi:hypothetical protein
MAVNLLGASNARVDFGDLAIDAGVTALTVSITFLASAVADDERLASHWGAVSANLAWVLAVTDTNELAIAVSDGGGGGASLLGRKTTDLDFATGTLYRCVFRWRADPKAMEIWVNGVNRTVGIFAGLDGTPATLTDSSSSIQVGHETAEGLDGVDGDYSEFAIHPVYMPDHYCIAYGNGYSPRFYPRANSFYCPLWNTSNLLDIWSSAVGSNSSGTNAAHPPIIKPIGLHPAVFVAAVTGEIALISSQVALVTSRRMVAY